MGKTVYLDVGVGPSLDIYGFTDSNVERADSGIGAGAAPGIATKLALGLGGGPDEESPRRVAFKLSVDPHLNFIPRYDYVFFWVPIGLGAEWF